MIRAVVILQFSFIAIFAENVQAETCAQTFGELDRSERLQSVKTLFTQGTRSGLVNQTQGTYIILEAQQDRIQINLYTSGLFDLYGIHRESRVVFCDQGDGLVLQGLGEKTKVRIEKDQIFIGDGGARYTFRPGPVPALLQKLHTIEPRRIEASAVEPAP